MNKVTFAAAIALATALPLSAQDSAMPDRPSTAGQAASTMSAEQQRDFDSWPPDRRSQYEAWPENTRTYYWTLDADQQRGWWLLNDDQRMRIMAMTPEQQAQTWASINQQLQGTAPPPAAPPPANPGMTPPDGAMPPPAQSRSQAPMTGSTPGAMGDTTSPATAPATAAARSTAVRNMAGNPGSVRWTDNTVMQQVPPPPQGEYPVCTATRRDSCRNPGGQ